MLCRNSYPHLQSHARFKIYTCIQSYAADIMVQPWIQIRSALMLKSSIWGGGHFRCSAQCNHESWTTYVSQCWFPLFSWLYTGLLQYSWFVVQITSFSNSQSWMNWWIPTGRFGFPWGDRITVIHSACLFPLVVGCWLSRVLVGSLLFWLWLLPWIQDSVDMRAGSWCAWCVCVCVCVTLKLFTLLCTLWTVTSKPTLG